MEAATGSQLAGWVSQGPRNGSRDGAEEESKGASEVEGKVAGREKPQGDALWAGA